MMKKISKTIYKYLSLISQGLIFKDKLIILAYFIKTPIHLIKQKLNISCNGKLIGNVTIKSKEGVFFCGDNIFSVWMGSSFHEPEIKKYLDIKKGVFIDIGANIGKHSILVSKRLDRTGKVIAIEPELKNLRVLEKNIRLNNLLNIKVIPLACSNKKGISKFYIDYGVPGGHSLYKKENKKEINVKTDTLDNILKSLKIKRVDLIKIDVEGAEAEVLKGATKTLKNSHPKIIFEAWNEEYLEKCKKILDRFGYKIKKIALENYLAY